MVTRCGWGGGGSRECTGRSVKGGVLRGGPERDLRVDKVIGMDLNSEHHSTMI